MSDTTSIETNVAAPVVEAGAAETVDYSNVDIDALLDAAIGKPEATTNHKGLNYQEVVDALPENAKKLVANLRADHTRKSQALAAQKRELELREQAMLKQNQERLTGLTHVPEDTDIYTPEGLQKFIDAKVAERLLEQQAPMREQYEQAQRQQELQSFREANPDMPEYRDAIIKEMSANPALGLKEAFYIAKGKAAGSKELERMAEINAYKAATRQAGLKVQTGSNVQAVTPGKPKDMWEAYQQIQARNAK